MTDKFTWPIGVEGKEFHERDVRSFVEKQKVMLASLEAIKDFTETGELPIVNGKEKTFAEVLAGLDNWDIYCDEEFSGERKEEMKADLKSLRGKVESIIAEN